MKEKRIFKDKLDIVVLVILIVVFGIFAFFCDMAWCGDSYQYENQFPMREPVYSLILQFLKFVSGDVYMRVLGLVQNLLACVCIYWTFKQLSDIWNFKIFGRFATLICLLAPHIVTPLASKTHLIITNTVMTEGITLSLYYVWFVYAVKLIVGQGIKEKKISFMIRMTLLALVLAMTRGQLILCVLMSFVLYIVVTLFDKGDDKRSKIKKSIVFIVLFIVTILSKTQLTKWYNLIESGNYVNTISSKPMLLANIAYVCDEADADYIKDDDLRSAFREVLHLINENDISYKNAEGSIISKARFHEAGHETINFDYIDPEMRKVIYERYGYDEGEFFKLMISEDELCGLIAKQILPHIAGKYFRNYVIISVLGFVRSIAVERSILSIYALIMYLFAIALTIIQLRKNTANRQAWCMIFTLIMICGNVLGTALVIECITRYMIYNLPFFYITGMALVSTLRES